ncbi:kinase-like protein, partial [Canariomyces notabilis]
TLFHLVPTNQTAHDALLHPDNSHFVSTSPSRKQLGLEIGFHVPSTPSGRVITRLGRNADLILRGRAVSAVHVAFEIHPETLVVLLSVRSKNSTSVTIAPMQKAGHEEVIDGDCVIVYGQDYRMTIASHNFELIWRRPEAYDVIMALRELAIRGYQDSLQRLQHVRSRDLPTEFDQSELHTWHNTRIHTARKVLFREAEGAPRALVGEGQFGKVFRAVDLVSGNPFAVKVVLLHKYTNMELARAALHREVKTLEKLKHRNIVEYLGTAKWDTIQPEIFMPLRPGSLRSLVETRDSVPVCDDDSLCMQVLEQMLCALDYLASHGLCHRDVKPENILYWPVTQGVYGFQLADFGLANHQSLAKTFCGTGYYQAPETHILYGQFSQSPKVDVWSLFATIIDVHRDFTFPPWDAKSYHDVLLAIRVAATKMPKLSSMVREDPAQRASAAQLLVTHFGGQGLTTPRAAVPPI